MLRRKLIKVLTVLTALLLTLAVGAVIGMQQVFEKMDHLTQQADTAIYRLNRIQMDISTVELELYDLRAGRTRHLDTLIDAVERLRLATDGLGDSYIVHESDIRSIYQQMRRDLMRFDEQAAILATTQDPDLSLAQNERLIALASTLRQAGMQISEHAHRHHQQETAEMTASFRWTAIAVAMGFLIVINLSILLMLRMSVMILRPVSQLAHASRQLAQQKFDTRVHIDQQDEFDELGRAYNDMAEQLEQAEQRRIELLQHAARTLNHELNTAIGIIDLQLTLLRRSTAGDSATARRLQQIYDSLRRMSEVVEALKHIRRIVLTDYVPGTKMLDLERSISQGSSDSSGEADAGAAPPPASAAIPASSDRNH